MANNSNYLLLFLAVALFGNMAMAQQDARRYIDFSSARAQKVMAVVSKSEVQRDLNLTTNQLNEITVFRQRRPKDIPALTNLLAQIKAADKSKRATLNEELWKRTDEYLLNSLASVLTPAQAKRLDEIVHQVNGLSELDQNSELANQLGLSKEQTDEVKDTLDFYRPVLKPLYQKLGRALVAGLAPDETMEDRTTEANSWSDAITIIEKQKDRDLSSILSKTQKENWQKLLGRPLEIHWETRLTD